MKTLKLDNIEIWPILRTYFYFEYISQNKEDTSDNSKEQINPFWRNIFYGLKNLFKRKNFIFSTDTAEYFRNGDIYIHKLGHHLQSELGFENILLISRTSDKFHHLLPKANGAKEVSFEFFDLLSKLIRPFLSRSLEINNEELLYKIYNQYDVEIRHRAILSQFLVFKHLVGLLLKLNRPKCIFITQYYHVFQQALIYVAKEKEIPVVEFQHGIINEVLPSYNIFYKPSEKLFPDYLLSFGRIVEEKLPKENYLPKFVEFIPIGNFYLEFVSKSMDFPNQVKQKLDKLRSKFDLILTISSQERIENQLLKFTKDCSKILPQVLFIYVPRRWNRDYESIFTTHDNVILFPKLNVYQAIKIGDIHVTGYSTTALEAPILGKPNILIDIDGKASRTYGSLLTNKTVTKIINTPNEMKEILKEINLNEETIKSNHSKFYRLNHQQIINELIEKLN